MSPIEKTLLSLNGLSIGDGFGAALGEMGMLGSSVQLIADRKFPTHLRQWYWTDDTHMALSIIEILAEFGTIEQDKLATAFATRFIADNSRGYAGGAIRLMYQISQGGDWRALAPNLFEGGSYGNGGAMRAAPIGAYFQGDPDRAAVEARKSAVITHAHPEGQAGAVAVAVAAAIVADPNFRTKETFLTEVARHIPSTQTAAGIELAKQIPADQFRSAVEQLGTGWKVSAQDTVPFCLWCVSHHFDEFEEAMWTTAAGGGDCDTTCAIVGGIMALSVGNVPAEWLAHREPLPDDFVV